MRKHGAVLAVGFFLGVLILTLGAAVAENVSWVNPTRYTDGTTIPSAKAAQLSTEIQYKIGAGAWTAYGTAVNGAMSFSAPYVTPGGGFSSWRIRSISVLDNNSTSVWSGEVAYTRPFQSPEAGSSLVVQ